MITPQRKVIISQTPEDIDCGIPNPNVKFQVDRFNNAIDKKGYRVTHEKALKCSCINPVSGSPLPDCTNCAGIGYFYVEKTLTRALVQSMGNSKKFENWSEVNPGTANITTKYTEQVTYMDRFTLLDLELNFSQIVVMRQKQNRIFGFLIYYPFEVFAAYTFNTSNDPLKHLINKTDDPDNWDYFIENSRLELNPAKFIYKEDFVISIRYKTRPVYYITDIRRELFKTQDGDCCDIVNDGCDPVDNNLVGMPQLSVGKRAHYMWDAPTMEGVSTQDNTVYSKFEEQDLKLDDYPDGNLLEL